MNILKKTRLFSILLLCFAMHACINDKDMYEAGKYADDLNYIYPFQNERQNITAQILIKTKGDIHLAQITSEIPALKYNKSWLFMLSQNSCVHSAYSVTWAAINGKPLSRQYYYDAAHLISGDLPPDIYSLNKTLGSTDGAGNEVRFHITTTLAPEEKFMDATTTVYPDPYGKNYTRFYMKSGLVWSNVLEMLNYGTGISFYALKVDDDQNVASIKKHFALSQEIITKKLSGRECKMLFQPINNATYTKAAQDYLPIHTITSQEREGNLYPFQINTDLFKKIIQSHYTESTVDIRKIIEDQMKLSKEQREGISVGIRNTDSGWIDFLVWLNNTYGQDGDDSVWFPSQEEYYEYNYYRTHGSTQTTKVDNNTFKLTIELPSNGGFYYPSITVNLKGLPVENIVTVSSDSNVSGLSFAEYANGTMINIDCRKYLEQHAIHYVERYEKYRSKMEKADALYFINMLKDSDKKTELLNRLK